MYYRQIDANDLGVRRYRTRYAFAKRAVFVAFTGDGPVDNIDPAKVLEWLVERGAVQVSLNDAWVRTMAGDQFVLTHGYFATNSDTLAFEFKLRWC